MHINSTKTYRPIDTVHLLYLLSLAGSLINHNLFSYWLLVLYNDGREICTSVPPSMVQRGQRSSVIPGIMRRVELQVRGFN